jgi:hypothetical protein
MFYRIVYDINSEPLELGFIFNRNMNSQQDNTSVHEKSHMNEIDILNAKINSMSADLKLLLRWASTTQKYCKENAVNISKLRAEVRNQRDLGVYSKAFEFE